MPQLVCEGRCNANRASLDYAVRAYRESPLGRLMQGAPVPTLPDHLTMALRKLVSTSHGDVSPDVYVCRVCETTRRWGNTL